MEANTKDESKTVVFSKEQCARYRSAWGGMRYGALANLSYDMMPEAMLGNLERFQKVMVQTADREEARTAELQELRAAVGSLGTLLKLAAKLSK